MLVSIVLIARVSPLKEIVGQGIHLTEIRLDALLTLCSYSPASGWNLQSLPEEEPVEGLGPQETSHRIWEPRPWPCSSTVMEGSGPITYLEQRVGWSCLMLTSFLEVAQEIPGL